MILWDCLNETIWLLDASVFISVIVPRKIERGQAPSYLEFSLNSKRFVIVRRSRGAPSFFYKSEMTLRVKSAWVYVLKKRCAFIFHEKRLRRARRAAVCFSLELCSAGISLFLFGQVINELSGRTYLRFLAPCAPLVCAACIASRKVMKNDIVTR